MVKRNTQSRAEQELSQRSLVRLTGVFTPAENAGLQPVRPGAPLWLSQEQRSGPQLLPAMALRPLQHWPTALSDGADILFGSFHTLFGFTLENILLRLKKKIASVSSKVCTDENAVTVHLRIPSPGGTWVP